MKVEDHDVAWWGIEVSEKTELITLGLGPQARLNGSGRARSGKFTSQEGDHARPRTDPCSRVRGTASSKAVVSTGEWMPSLGHDGDAGIPQDFSGKPTSPYSGSEKPALDRRLLMRVPHLDRFVRLPPPIVK